MNKGVLALLVAACFYCYASGAEVLLVKLMNIKPENGGAGVLLRECHSLHTHRSG